MSIAAAPPITPATQTPEPPARGGRLAGLAWLTGPVALSLIVAVARVPSIGRVPSPDEGGFLLVGSQWSPGTSLYGNYWVDRPPLLITIFVVAAHLGGAVALRLIGILVVSCSILLAAVLGRSVTMTRSNRNWLPMLVAAIMLSSPLLDTGEVNGELLAVPFVLLGVLGTWRCVQAAQRRRALMWGLLSGAAGMAAASVKQNVVDVFVLSGVLAVTLALSPVGRPRARRLMSVAVGALLTLVGMVIFAANRGTSLGELTYALIGFRLDAATVIHASASSATPMRLRTLLAALALSGAPLLVIASGCVARSPLRHPVSAGPGDPEVVDFVADLRVPAIAMLVWELVAVGLGGSYWLHYLVGVIPGLIVLAVAACQRPWSKRQWLALAGGLAWTSLASGVGVVGMLAVWQDRLSSDGPIISYLHAHERPGDTAVLAFGHPDVLWSAGLSSPYPELWSLPVRVRDPHLAALDAVLNSPQRPTWVVVNGTSLYTWGVDPSTAERTLLRRYDKVADVAPYAVYLREGLSRSAGSGSE